MKAVVADNVISASMLIRPAEIDGLELSDCVYRGDASFPRHAHPFHSLFIVLGGGVTERSGRLAVDCAPGAIGFIPAGVEHSSIFDGAPAHTLALTIDDDWLRRNSPGLVGTAAYRESPDIVSMGLRLYSSCHRRDASWRVESEELLINLMNRLASIDTRESEGRRPAWIADAAEAVRAHYSRSRGGAIEQRVCSTGTQDSGLRTQDSALGVTSDSGSLSLADISAATGRDPAHICRTFKSSFGVSITQFTKLLRVRRACTLLRTTTRPVTSIALDTGFCDQAHLTRAFRAVLGTTPAVYRARFGR